MPTSWLGETSVTTFLGHSPEASTSAIVSSATLCSRTRRSGIPCERDLAVVSVAGLRGGRHAGAVDIAVEPHLEQAALITIDTQVDTLDGQPLEIPGTSSILPNLRELCKGFREANRPIVHVVRLYLADGSNAEPVRKSLVAGSVPVLRPGSPGRLLAPGLGPDEHFELDDDLLLAGGIQHLGPLEAMIYKPRWGAFYNTPLQTHLDTHGVNTLVFGGCNFPNCPRTSIYEASERDYGTVLAEDATSGLYDRGRTELINIGVSLLSTHWLIAALTAISPLPSPAPGPAAS